MKKDRTSKTPKRASCMAESESSERKTMAILKSQCF